IILPAWLIQIARRRAIRWLEKRKRRSAYEGPMPTHVAREDDYTGEAVETVDPSDTSYDPTSDEEPAELLGTHLHHFIGDHLRRQEVRAIIREHSEEGKTYTDIAAARGLTEAQIANRILRFKKKYATRVTRRRTLFAVFKVLGWLAFGAFVFAVTWWLLHRRSDDIRPDPSRAVPSSSPSSSSSAPVFLQALPPGPDPSEQPPKP